MLNRSGPEYEVHWIYDGDKIIKIEKILFVQTKIYFSPFSVIL